jgi:hypothetical protein
MKNMLKYKKKLINYLLRPFLPALPALSILSAFPILPAFSILPEKFSLILSLYKRYKNNTGRANNYRTITKV